MSYPSIRLALTSYNKLCRVNCQLYNAQFNFVKHGTVEWHCTCYWFYKSNPTHLARLKNEKVIASAITLSEGTTPSGYAMRQVKLLFLRGHNSICVFQFNSRIRKYGASFSYTMAPQHKPTTALDASPKKLQPLPSRDRKFPVLNWAKDDFVQFQRYLRNVDKMKSSSFAHIKCDTDIINGYSSQILTLGQSTDLDGKFILLRLYWYLVREGS